jgi:hypothetical protein|tara:strand:+ start:414 stop:671 length:258 start_codon:yes stop_codon:yes gene_type:complete
MPNDSALILEHGPTDGMGVNHFYIYCRKCNMISDAIGPGCLGMLTGRKFDHQKIIDPAALLSSEPNLIAAFPPRLRAAFEADRIA